MKAHAPLRWLLAPLHAAALATSAKSFRDNPILGSPTLNAMGLHVARMRLAQAMAAQRRRRLAHLVDAGAVADFERDGFIMKPDFLPPAEFAALQAEALTCRAPARDMLQGDAVTRRIALDAPVLAKAPALKRLLRNPDWIGPIRYVGSSAITPVCYIQSIFSRVREGAVDPQTRLHADTFHPTVKAWLFLTDVEEDDGPFVYVPGSHRPNARRLAWERRMSMRVREGEDFQAMRGSPRITAREVRRLGLPEPKAFAVKANTLIVADTAGFHARGRSARASTRVEVWAYGRRNPFLPWAGLAVSNLPVLRDWLGWYAWTEDDLKERMGLRRAPWRPTGLVLPTDPPDLGLQAGR